MSNDLTYAIDFGTSNSLLAATRDGQAIPPLNLDPTNEDATVMRSLMYYPRGDEPVFGQSAIRRYVEEEGEGRFIRSIKKYLPSPNFTGTQINNKSYSLEELISRFLREMKSRADEHFGYECENVILGRPALFSTDKDRDSLAQSRLEEAAKLAGFKNIDFFPEPLAAAYGYRQELKSEKLVLVVDLGGGTSDFTVIKLHPNRYSDKDVLAIGGVSVAGDALDGCIMGDRIAPHLGSKVTYRMPMSSNILSMPGSLKFSLMSPADITLMSKSDIMDFLQQVRKCAPKKEDQEKLDQLFSLINDNLGFAIFEEIEKCKRQVCSHEQGNFLFDRDDIFIEDTFTSDQFSSMIEGKIDNILSTMDETIRTAQVRPDDIDAICCTGGTSKVPSVETGLLERFGPEKISSFNNFHSVIQGISQRSLHLIS